MKIKYVLGLLVIMLLLVGCGLYSGEQTSDEVMGDIVDEVKDKVSEVSEGVSDKVGDVVSGYDSEVLELIKKGENRDNFQYTYKYTYRESNGNYFSAPVFDLYMKENKVKKVYLSPIKNDGVYYREVYFVDGKVLGVCDTKSVLCDDAEGMVYDIQGEDLGVTPIDILDDLPYRAEVKGTEMFDGRKVTVVQYEEGDTKVKVYIDPYYGLPLKKVIYGFDDDEEIVLKRWEFTNIAAGNVRNADVSLE